MVGMIERCLRKVLGKARLTFDELSTILTEIEGTLNAQPITYQDEDLGQALTPSPLLCGRRLAPISEGALVVSEEDCHSMLSKRFVYLSRKLTHFWNRWRKDYLINLREFHKQKYQKEQLI